MSTPIDSYPNTTILYNKLVETKNKIKAGTLLYPAIQLIESGCTDSYIVVGEALKLPPIQFKAPEDTVKNRVETAAQKFFKFREELCP